MRDGNVMDFNQELDDLLKGMGKPLVEDASPQPTAAPATTAPLDQLGPLPRLADAYAAHARLANGPLMTLFLLPTGGLPRGFAYHSLDEVSMVDAENPGGSPDMVLLLAGLRPKQVRIEGRGLLALCDYIGRHLIHWLREHPTGRDDGNGVVFIRRISIIALEE